MRKNVLTGVSKERISEIMEKQPKDMDATEFRIYKRVLYEEWNGRGRKHARQSFDTFKKWSKDFTKFGHAEGHYIVENQNVQVATEENPENENVAEIAVKPEWNWRSNKVDKVIQQVEFVIEGNYEDDVVKSFNDRVKDLKNLDEVVKIASEYVQVNDLRQKKSIEESSVSTEGESVVSKDVVCSETVAL